MERFRGANVYSIAVEGMTHLLAKADRQPSLANVAACIDISEDELAVLFPTADDLMIAMAENAMVVLHHTLAECVARVTNDDPVEQLIAIANAYVEWAYRYPREFRIMGSMPAETFEDNERLLRYERSIQDLMIKLMERAVMLKLVPEGRNLTTFISIARTFAYGIASKMLLGDLARWNPGMTDADAARHTLRIFILQFLRPETQA